MSTLTGILAALILVLSWRQEASADDQLDRGRKAIRAMTGCYLVDYSFVETESFKPGYVRDPRVYDVNRDKSVKEWIPRSRCRTGGYGSSASCSPPICAAR